MILFMLNPTQAYSYESITDLEYVDAETTDNYYYDTTPHKTTSKPTPSKGPVTTHKPTVTPKPHNGSSSKNGFQFQI